MSNILIFVDGQKVTLPVGMVETLLNQCDIFTHIFMTGLCSLAPLGSSKAIVHE